MKPFDSFSTMDPSFWAFVKFISENLGYTDRGEGLVKYYTPTSIFDLCRNNNLNASKDIVEKASHYSVLRAELLNNFAQKMLMNAETAKEEFLKLEGLYRTNHFTCKLPFNKQKGSMKQIAYFTAIINILAEKTVREKLKIRGSLGFDDDPRGLLYVIDENREIIGASSRRFDGAFPSITSPYLVWEIKEYYYATTFGSRVADGVYETQLDGFEFKELSQRTSKTIYHLLFIDAYRTWWVQGKSYLCRLVDAMNSGLVNEVIVGKEVLSRWPELLNNIIEENIESLNQFCSNQQFDLMF